MVVSFKKATTSKKEFQIKDESLIFEGAFYKKFNQ